jgi:hypothetical protein
VAVVAVVVDLRQVDVPIKITLEPAVLYQEPLGNPRVAMMAVVVVAVAADKTVVSAAQLLVATMVLTQAKMAFR